MSSDERTSSTSSPPSPSPPRSRGDWLRGLFIAALATGARRYDLITAEQLTVIFVSLLLPVDLLGTVVQRLSPKK